MKKIIFTLIVSLISVSSYINAQVIAVEGHYQGRDIYVQNPFSASGVGFCVFEVRVNGMVTTDEINSSAFAIDLALLNLNFGDPVTIEIAHKDGCDPIIINPEALKPLSTYEIVGIRISENGLLNWATKNEAGKLPFIIEQFRWNKWVKVGEVEGNGTPGENKYQFQIMPHYGVNKVRIKQVDSSKKPRYSKALEFESNLPPVTFSPVKVKKEITFSRNTLYEIYNLYGNIVAQGYMEKIDVSNLDKGKYYLNYDNNFGDTFEKK
jgi:hypothetical protein